VFDSGVGGLTVAREIFAHMPHEEIVYFGDTGRAPYGGKEPDVIRSYGRQICEYLVGTHNVKALAIACTTIDALYSHEILRTYGHMPVVGVIRPGCAQALAAESVGLMATLAAVNSKAHERTFREMGADQPFHPQACPSLARLVEEGKAGQPETYHDVQTYVSNLLTKGVQTIILGCTHYPLIMDEVRAAVGTRASIIDPAAAAARNMRQELHTRGLTRPAAPPNHKFILSKKSPVFDSLCMSIMGYVPDALIHSLEP